MNEELRAEIDKVRDEINTKFYELYEKVQNMPDEEQSEPEQYGLWKPKKYETYYFIDEFNDICNREFCCTELDNARISIGNCFKTQEEAEKHLEHLKVETQLREIAARLNKGREIDWETGIKYCLLLDTAHNFINQYHGENAKYQGTIYCLNPDFKDVAIAEIGEERLKEYLKNG